MPKIKEELLAKLKEIEKARRAENYEALEVFVDSLDAQLDGDVSGQAHCARSRVRYEQHMACYQRAMKETGAVKSSLLWQSLTYARSAALYANLGDDPAGRLYAEMNIGGLILPEQGKWERGLSFSTDVCEEAERFSESATSESEKRRLLNIAMNTYAHRIRHARKNGATAEDVLRWGEAIKENPVFKDSLDQDSAQEVLRQVAEFTAIVGS